MSRVFRVSLVVLCVALFVASVVPLPDATPKSGPAGFGFTAWFHLFGYAALAALCRFDAVTDRFARPYAVAVGFAVGYGSLIELTQGFLPWRTMSGVDVLVNASGAALGAIVVWIRDRPYVG
ncbi:VanZ family protein [Haloferacaceae archaeon DSL9]